MTRLFVLSTQTFKWFQSRAGFAEGELSELPEPRHAAATSNGRNSKALFKSLE